MASPYSRTRNKQLVRVLRLLHLIGTRRRSLRELADELGVSTRTIRRDFEAIEAAHLPLRDVLGSDGIKRWRLESFGGTSVTTLLSRGAA